MDQEYQREEKLDGEFQVQKSPVLAWLDNFWYHYKWHTLVSLFFVVVLVIGFVQFLDRPQYDVNFIVAGTYRMDNEQVVDYNKVLNGILPEDYDGNGEKNVNIVAYQIYSDAELKEEISKAQAEAEAESERYDMGPQFVKYITDEKNNFFQYTMTGESYVCLLSPYLYQQLLTENRLYEISNLYEGEEMPQGVTQDGYGIYINQTHLYAYHPAMQAMPDDMILCFLRPQAWKDQSCEKDKAFFHAIADYQVKE